MGRNDGYHLPGGNEPRIRKKLNGVCCYEDAVQEGRHDLDCDNHEINRELYYRRTFSLPVDVIIDLSKANEGPAWIWPSYG